MKPEFSSEFRTFLTEQGFGSPAEILMSFTKILTELTKDPTKDLEKWKSLAWDKAHEMAVDHLILHGSKFPLDVGTGTEAALSLAYLKKACSDAIITSIDSKENHVKHNTRRHSRLIALFGDATSIELQQDLYDGLISSFCLEYIPPKKLVETLRRLGKFLITGSPFSIATYGSEWEEKFPNDFSFGELPSLFSVNSGGDWNPINIEVLLSALAKAGFKVTENAYNTPNTDDPMTNLMTQTRITKGFYLGD